ncbi:MAG TPA: DUF4402 domain-containing protein [Bacteroidales bacterium]|nr:DUF4402 domain-containing protein [Bacteroidales bacterium]
MISERHITNTGKCLIIITATFLFLFITSLRVYAQENPPRPPLIAKTFDLAFGAFYHGAAGGTVSVDENDSRSSSGDVVLLGLGYPVSAARFNINSNPGTLINILSIPDFTLSWNSYTMLVEIENSNPSLPFVNNNDYSIPTELSFGARLHVGNSLSNPPGSYSGSFEVTLVIE